jgi:hypothetical protein
MSRWRRFVDWMTGEKALPPLVVPPPTYAWARWPPTDTLIPLAVYGDDIPPMACFCLDCGQEVDVSPYEFRDGVLICQSCRRAHDVRSGSF